jgi:hypothetical protein
VAIYLLISITGQTTRPAISGVQHKRTIANAMSYNTAAAAAKHEYQMKNESKFNKNARVSWFPNALEPFTFTT